MTRQIKLEVKCPYCGHSCKMWLTGERRPLIMLCDSEEGGCDREFAANVSVRYEVQTFELIPHLPVKTQEV